MSYSIEWRPSARKEVRKLDPPIRRRVLAAIDALANDPHPPEATTITGAPGVFRIRVGDFGLWPRCRRSVWATGSH